MHEFVSYNGEIIRSVDARLPAMSAAGLYGKGVFTTLAVAHGIKDSWYEHSLRIAGEARKLGMDTEPLDLVKIGDAIDELVRQNQVIDGRVRVTFFDEGPTGLWPASLPARISVLITTGDRRPPEPDFKLTVSPFPINSASPLAGMKSCNYLENIIAKDEARSRGFDECIRLNERGEIASAAMANVFWQKGGTVFTPSLKTGCVPGTTRLQVLESFVVRKRMVYENPLNCVEVEMGIAELEAADEIFLTSAGLGVVQVAEFDGRRLVRDEFNDLVWGFRVVAGIKNTRNRSE